ncbi:MAG: protein kinase, partial [Acidobacteria bacterium]|nr:protein kinase [Acidobacteriota bacterium]
MIQAKIDPKYEIVRKLREGGMGAIFLVRHRLLDELRVIKVLRSELVTDQDLRQRFLREAKIAIQLRHPNIAQLYDFSIDEEGTAWIVLEYIDGITLEEYLRQPEARHLPLTLAIAQQGLRALGYLHRKGFVHRDISPDNLMLTRDVDGEPLVKLIDLGIVKILQGEGKGTATSLYLGKPKYSSPEQLVSQDIDARSDLYSFGVLLYELVTGVYPIHGHDLPSLITGHLHRDPVEFSVSDPGNQVPESLRRVIRDAMAKARDQRIPSAEEFSRRLAEVADSLSAEQQGESRHLLESARDGARRERERALAEAESDIREQIERHDFGDAREHLALAVERLGNDTRLAALLEAIQAGEQERRQAVAESGRLDRMLDEAEEAFERGDLPEAMSKAFEVLARDPHHTRGRLLQERIDRKRKAGEAVAGPTQATVVGVAGTQKSGEIAVPSPVPASPPPAAATEAPPVAPTAKLPQPPPAAPVERELEGATAVP